MISPEEQVLLESYVQADAPARRDLFGPFVRVLKAVAARGGAESITRWIRQSVSVDLDYSSHLSLNKVIKQVRRPTKDAVRVAVLGGPTTTQMVWLMENFLFGHGIHVEFWEGEYGLFRQSILMPDPALDAFHPQIIFLATSGRDVGEMPSLAMAEADIARQAQMELEQWQHLWRTVHERWGAQLIQNSFDIEPWSVLGHYSHRTAASPERYVARLNQLMADGAPGSVVLHDLQALALEAGARQWFDPRYYYEAKMPCAPECLVPYAHSVASLVAAIKGRSRKVIVLDLDNTLWGGIIGDDGVGGIRAGQGSAEGESFLAFQRYLKRMSQRGVLLAVCSKNETRNAREPFERLPEMVLKLDDFSSFVANWDNKVDNIRRIAEELNLGMDSFVFVDDNPAERALVRLYLPEVAVPDMPQDPAGFIQAVASHRYFEMVTLTAEDLKRATFYIQNRQRREFETVHTDVAGFLASLDMHALVEPLDEVNIERCTQLINKSNQFNLTTRRYTLAEVGQKASSNQWFTLAISLRDKFGDNGLISVILADVRGEELNIDTWVMSCRVLQRGVEHLAVNILMDAARLRGCTCLAGTYIPSPKNGMVREHYARLGFEKCSEDDTGTTRWRKRLGPESERLATHITAPIDPSQWPKPAGGA